MKRMKLGYFFTGFGHHVASCRHVESLKRGGMNLEKIIEQVKIIEQAKFDFLFFSDALYLDKKTHPDVASRFEPFTLMSIISTHTKDLGLIVTGSTTFSEPFSLARSLSSLDHISEGRAGWNIVTSGINDTAKNFNRTSNINHDLRYEQAEEFIQITTRLWDSWSDVHFEEQQEKGYFFNERGPQRINYEGKFYSVQGPLNIETSPQVYPLLVQAGSSKKGSEFASKFAEVVFTAQNNLDDAITFVKHLKESAKYQRNSQQEVVVMPGIFPVIGDTREEAEQNYEELQELIVPEVGLELLSSYLGDLDLSSYDLTTPFENIELQQGNNIQSRVKLISDTAKSKQYTLEDVMKHVAGARGHHIVIGTATDIADKMEEWFRKGAADGFNIMPPLNPTQFELFVEKVIPILQERNLIQVEYNPGTLREKLGLNHPYDTFQ
ncbi:LLM class flavin-dependent oxidoreductase [Staphylococcus gallinarum]|uniref:LLM class flavin-dependent oxidoreductase n=1 Tax=Staphylococcus gallinarum TaxID=1293 RepID=A0A3A0VR09_STAGA|nr:LLM class flavin-dependent oxidoreductase [Staphylococcus gallinarum]RIP34870.1 LLM class flavin-dependent oxidoreductase [Staphylococcus gallinarum]